MKRTIGIVIVLILACAAFCGAESQYACPAWGWYETSLFYGQLAGYTGAAICTVYIVVPILMDMYWYSPGPTGWDDFWPRLGSAIAAQPIEALIALACDVVFLSGAIVCSVLMPPPADRGEPGSTTLSFMGLRVGR